MIQVRNVSKRFGRVAALSDVTLHVRAGERVAIVGTNGSGKTTLLRSLCGLLTVNGQVLVNDIDVGQRPSEAMRSLAYMPQIAPPLDAPVSDLVRAWCTLRGRTHAEVAARAQALGLTLDAVLRSRVRDLSGGTKQKLLGALALAADTPLLICDEPTANLDVQARVAFFEAVNARPRSATLVLCSHRVDEVRHLVDRVIELREGRVVNDETVAARLAMVRSVRLEVAFHRDVDADLEAPALLERGFTRLGAARFVGNFSQTQKLDVVASLVCTLGARLADLSVHDAESLHEDTRRAS